MKNTRHKNAQTTKSQASQPSSQAAGHQDKGAPKKAASNGAINQANSQEADFIIDSLQHFPSLTAANFDKNIPTSLHQPNEELEPMLTMMNRLFHWAAIIESSDDAIISKSTDGHITSWNSAAQRIYGYSAAEIVGQPVSILIPAEKEDDFPNIMEKLRNGERVDHYETKRKAKDGRIIDVSITVSPIKDAYGNIIGASKIARDISDRIEANRRRDSFVSTVSHELKSPITSQRIYGELLESQLSVQGSNQQHLDLIKKINEQTNKLETLVNDLLELSRMASGQIAMNRQVVSLDTLIHEAVAETQLTTDKKIILNLEQGLAINADAMRISQVMTNLMSNAIKYSPEADKIIVSSYMEGDEIVISVQDFGIGVPKKDQQKIFERFYRIAGEDQSTFPGMGIGLNFSQEVISRHHGTLSVESTEGQGSTFYVRLPKANLSKQRAERGVHAK